MHVFRRLKVRKKNLQKYLKQGFSSFFESRLPSIPNGLRLKVFFVVILVLLTLRAGNMV